MNCNQKASLLESGAAAFVHKHVFWHTPFVFGHDYDAWIEWRAKVAGLLEVDPQCVLIEGSAMVGYSMNPNKPNKQFGPDSDIDCSVVSDLYFNLAWYELREIRKLWSNIEPKSRAMIEEHRKNYLFSGIITTEKNLQMFSFASKWQRAIDWSRS